GAVTATVDRAPLRTVQYPRGFDAAVLARLISGAPEAFDEMEAGLSGNVAVSLVDGDIDSMSVELPGDSGYLAAVIEGRSDHPGR
ncbi:4-diphosphocytidyl-2C-methyl-D-erythritol kinase, partial [Mycobacterium sp. ITM-2017-0098]